jgi:hypothetical protein
VWELERLKRVRTQRGAATPFPTRLPGRKEKGERRGIREAEAETQQFVESSLSLLISLPEPKPVDTLRFLPQLATELLSSLPSNSSSEVS